MTSEGIGIQALDRAARIVSLVCEAGSATVGDVSAALGLERTTSYRYLSSMAAVGFLERVGSERGGSFRIGRLGEVMAVAAGGGDLVAAARRRLPSLADELRATVVLGVPTGDRVTVIEVAHPDDLALSVSLRVGYVVPADGAQSIAALAGREESAVEAVAAELPAAARAGFRRGVDQLRERGSVTLTIQDAYRVAAVPLTQNGHVVATIACLDHLGEEREAAPVLVRAARLLTGQDVHIVR